MEIGTINPNQTKRPEYLTLSYYFEVPYIKNGVLYNPEVKAYIDYNQTKDEKLFIRAEITTLCFEFSPKECHNSDEFEIECIEIIAKFAPLEFRTV